MILYHGSNIVVDKPQILQSERLLDFGAGFYTTTNKEQSIRWARKVCIRRKTKEQYISVYEFDLELAEKTLTVVRFAEKTLQYCVFKESFSMGGENIG